MATSVDKTTPPKKSEIEKLIEEYSPWYHSMNLGYGLRTPGRYGENLVAVAALMKHVDFRGLNCLDLGTANGKMSFLMEKLGANVLATDTILRPAVPKLIEMFDSKVETFWGLSYQDLPKFRKGGSDFDFILCSGVLYHIPSPFDCIFNVRRSVRRNGYVIFESACIDDTKSRTMTFNTGDIHSDPSTYWVPTIACMRYLIEYACFRIEAEATRVFEGQVPRHAILAKAVGLDEAKENKDDWISRVCSLASSNDPTASYLPHTQFGDAEKTTTVKLKNLKRGTKYKLKKNRAERFIEELNLLELGTPARLEESELSQPQVLIELFAKETVG